MNRRIDPCFLMTREQLHAYAQEQDGMCKVEIDQHGAIRLHPPDRELGYTNHWDYYYTDEVESFDFKQFNL